MPSAAPDSLKKTYNQVNINRSPWDPSARRFSLPPLPVWRLLTWQAPQGLAALVAMAVITATMAWGYIQSLSTVRMIVDGKIQSVHTNQATVATVLYDAGVTLYPQDRVVPPLDTRIEEGQVIRVDHARPVVVNVDGQTIHARTLKIWPYDILTDLGITVSPYDRLTVDGQPVEALAASSDGRLTTASLSNRSSSLIAQAYAERGQTNRASSGASNRDASQPVPSSITIQRAVTLTVYSTDAAPITLHTTAPTVGEALQETGMTLYLADKVQPDLGTPVHNEQPVTIDRAVPVTIVADGRHLNTRTHAKNVADVLAESGLSLQGLDYTDPAPNTLLMRDMAIRVVRVAETFSIEQEPVPFELQVEYDPTMEIDNQELRQAGENGVLQKRIRVRYEDGKEVSRSLEDSGIIRQPKTKVVAYGTKIVIRTMDTPNGPIEYWRKIRMLATSYSASTAGTPKNARYYGRTALGWVMRFGIVAVDPAVIKLGSQVYVPGYGIGDAGDTGGAIKNLRIDLGYEDNDPRVWTWHHWVDVYLLTPVPDNVRYVLPDWPSEP